MTLPTAPEVLAEPWRFEADAFFKELRRHFGKGDILDGSSVLFRGWPTFAFPAAEVMARSAARKDERVEFETPFLSLYGVTGVLPPYWTREIIDGTDAQSAVPPLREYLDVFNHRLAAMYGEAVAAGDPLSQPLTQAGQEGVTRFIQFVAAFVGMEAPKFLPPEVVVNYASILLHGPGQGAIEAALSDYFDTAVRVEVPPPDHRADQGGECEDAAEFFLAIGPMRYERYRSFLPGGSAFLPLLAFTRLMVGEGPSFGLRLRLFASDRPELVVSETDEGALVGWTSWLPGGDADEVDGIVTPGTCERAERASRKE